MTDEQLSELAECLADACRGKRLRPFNARDMFGPSCCPLGALIGDQYPNPGHVANATSIPSEITYGIARGFDGDGQVSVGGTIDPRAFALGRLFREECSR